MEKLNYETVRKLVDKYFEELSATFSTEQGLKCIIDTRDKIKLHKFFGERMVDYLSPARAIKIGNSFIVDDEPLKSFGSYQILNENDLNTMLRTPEMFFELEADQAKEYQSYFAEFRKNAEHLLYYTILQDWIDYLKECFTKYKATAEALKQQEQINNINEGPIFSSLEEVFINSGDFDMAIRALRGLKCIDENNSNLIGSKLKGVIQVWVRILREERNQLKYINDKKLTILLNKYFINLNLAETTDGRHLRNLNKTAWHKYGTKLSGLM